LLPPRLLGKPSSGEEAAAGLAGMKLTSSSEQFMAQSSSLTSEQKLSQSSAEETLKLTKTSSVEKAMRLPKASSEELSLIQAM
jgi:hypothetical protein